MPLHSPCIIQEATEEIVDAVLTVILKQVWWPCHYHICKERLPIHSLRVYAVAKPFDYTWCNTHKRWHSLNTLLTLCWCSVDALLTRWWRAVDALLTRCWRSVDVHFEVQRYPHTQYCLYRLPILRLWINAVAQPLDYTRWNTRNRWRSVDADFQTGAVTMSLSHLQRTAANTLIMGLCRSRALGLYMMQHPKALTLCWHSVDTLLMLCWRSVDVLLTCCWRSEDAHFELQQYRHTRYCL